MTAGAHSLVAPVGWVPQAARLKCRACSHQMRRHRALLCTRPEIILCDRCPFGICPDAEVPVSP